MNVALRDTEMAPALRCPAPAALLLAVGCAALVARPWLFGREQHEILLLVALGAVGVFWPVGPEPLAAFTTNPAGAAIVNAVGPIRQIVRGEARTPRRYLVIVSGTPGHLGARVQVQAP